MRSIHAKISLAILLTFSLGACGIQSIPRMVNEVEATWAEVTNQYKRRAYLIPNPVKAVKAYTAHEKETLEAVIAARTSATSMKIDPQNLTPEKLQQFQKLQGNPGAALGKLMVVAEVLEPSSKNLLTATLSPTSWRPDSNPHG